MKTYEDENWHLTLWEEKPHMIDFQNKETCSINWMFCDSLEEAKKEFERQKRICRTLSAPVVKT